MIEHIKNDDEVIEFLSKVLKNDGNILITVPAYNFLYTERDKILGHFRRYNSNMLKKKTNTRVFYLFSTMVRLSTTVGSL